MSCAEQRGALWEALDAGLGLGAECRAHLAGCRRCREYAAAARRVDAALSVQASAAEIDLVGRVLARLARRAPAPEGGLGVLGPALAGGLAAVAAWLAGGWGGAALWRGWPDAAAFVPSAGWLEPFRMAVAQVPAAALAWLGGAALYLWISTHRAAFGAAGRQR